MKGGETPVTPPASGEGRKHKGREVITQIFGGKNAGTVGEDDVILGEALLGGGRGGDDEDWAGAEEEVKDVAMLLGELGEVLVDGCLEKVEVAKDGESQGFGKVDVEIPFGYETENHGDDDHVTES